MHWEDMQTLPRNVSCLEANLQPSCCKVTALTAALAAHKFNVDFYTSEEQRCKITKYNHLYGN